MRFGFWKMGRVWGVDEVMRFGALEDSVLVGGVKLCGGWRGRKGGEADGKLRVRFEG